MKILLSNVFAVVGLFVLAGFAAWALWNTVGKFILASIQTSPTPWAVLGIGLAAIAVAAVLGRTE